jgi:hypothetical protein
MPEVTQDQGASAIAYRELCERMGPGPWKSEDMAEMRRLHAIGLQEGWLTETPISKDESGDAWNRTNPPKRGKKGNAKWRR